MMPTPAVGQRRGRSSCDTPTPRSSAVCTNSSSRTEGPFFVPKWLSCRRSRRRSRGVTSLGLRDLVESSFSDGAARHSQCKSARGFHYWRSHERGRPFSFYPCYPSARGNGVSGGPYDVLHLLRGDHYVASAGTLRVGPGSAIPACRRLVVPDHAGSRSHSSSPERVIYTQNPRTRLRHER
jgi:hypothetical protein